MGEEVTVDHPLSPDELVAYVLLDIAIILILARLMGALFRRLRQPAVVGEIVAGILLGPTVLGNIPLGDGRLLGTTLFPAAVRPSLTTLANVGLILFMFIVGLELNLRLIKGARRLATGISLASVALPFALGILLAKVLFPAHEVATSFVAFALFIGAAMSVTAFPVLARILTERSMHLIPLGVITLAAAAVDDVVAWSLLAVVTGVAEGTDQRHLLVMLGELLVFVAAMLFVVRPGLRRLSARYRRTGRLSPDVLAVILTGLLLSSYLTSVIGIHSIFGAFLFGAAMPREDNAALIKGILERIEPVSVLLLLPLFFVTTGFNVDLRGLDSDGLVELGLILLAACAGKFLGAAGAARLQGLPSRTSTALGLLMNTRGLTELVILKVGFDKGILDQQLFTLLVVMAVVTTVMTEPLLRLAYPDRLIARDIAAAERAALAVPGAYRVLVAVDDLAHARRLADVSLTLLRGRRPAQIVLSHFHAVHPTNRTLEAGSGLVVELAQIAESLEVLNDVAHSVGGRDVECTVLERASRNVAEDLPAQMATVHADAVLLDTRWAMLDWRPLARAVVDQDSCRLLVAHFGRDTVGGNACVCVLSGARSDAAVLEVAVSFAVVWSAPLLLVEQDSGTRRAVRRIESTADRLRRGGLRVSTARAGQALPSPARVLVTALSTQVLADGGFRDSAPRADAELTVLVRPAPSDDGEPDRHLARVLAAKDTTAQSGRDG